MSTLATLSKGNPGALQFLMELVSSGQIKVVSKIESSGIVGTDLYVLWSDLCDRDMNNVVKLVERCPIDVLKDACSRQDYSGKKLVSDYLK